MSSKVIRAITSDASVRAFAIDGKDIVESARNIHGLSVLSASALGRVLMGTSMMGCLLKTPTDSITLQVRGDGPLGNIVAISDYLGNVRGYVDNPGVELELTKDGHIDVGGGVGKGDLVVIKDLGLKEPYIGRVQIKTGEIAEDITSYFAKSEQVPTVCALGILFNSDMSIKAAGGFIVQLLPFVGDDIIELIENNIKTLPPVSKMLDEGESLLGMLQRVLAGMEVEVLQTDAVDYLCPCSRERMERALISLGKDELNCLIDEQGCAELVCHFCNTKHLFEKDELFKLLSSAQEIV